MNAELTSGAKYLTSLTPQRRAEFLAELSLGLTIAGRVLYHSDTPREDVTDDLYALNEIQHRVSGYMTHALGNDEDPEWVLPVLAHIFEQSNPRVRTEALNAWNRVLRRWQAAA
jgi:hypothetical protein